MIRYHQEQLNSSKLSNNKIREELREECNNKGKDRSNTREISDFE